MRYRKAVSTAAIVAAAVAFAPASSPAAPARGKTMQVSTFIQSVATDSSLRRAIASDDIGHRVFVVDMKTYRTVGSVGGFVGGREYLAVSSATHTAYAADGVAVTLVSMRSGKRAGAFQTGDGPRGLALDSRESRLYVSGDGKLHVYDARKNKQITQFAVPGMSGGGAQAVALDEVRNRIWLFDQDQAIVLSLSNGKIVATVALNRTAKFAALDAKRGRVYATTSPSQGSGESSLIVLDAKSPALLSSIRIPDAFGLAIRRDGRLFVTDTTASRLYAIDPDTMLVAASVPVGNPNDEFEALGVAYDAPSRTVLVANYSGELDLLSEASDEVPPHATLANRTTGPVSAGAAAPLSGTATDSGTGVDSVLVFFSLQPQLAGYVSGGAKAFAYDVDDSDSFAVPATLKCANPKSCVWSLDPVLVAAGTGEVIAPGAYQVTVVAQDKAGNWDLKPPSSLVVVI